MSAPPRQWIKDMEARQMPLMLAHVLGGGVVGPVATAPSAESEQINIIIIIIIVIIIIIIIMVMMMVIIIIT